MDSLGAGVKDGREPFDLDFGNCTGSSARTVFAKLLSHLSISPTPSHPFNFFYCLHFSTKVYFDCFF